MKPVLFVTGHAPPDRLAPFAALHEREDVVYALFGGRHAHGVEDAHGVDDAHAVDDAHGVGEAVSKDPTGGFPRLDVAQRDPLRLAGSGRYRAVICGSGGRVALPAAWRGARTAGVPFILWTSLWAHPRSAVHAASYLALARLYRSADAIVTYGSHVSAYVRARGARNVHIAPQAVDPAFWSVPAPDAGEAAGFWPAEAARFLFVGRPAREKGLEVLVRAWRASGLRAPAVALVLAGMESAPLWVPAGGAVALSRTPAAARQAFQEGAAAVAVGRQRPEDLRNFYAAADVLVIASIPTSAFREPWGLVANEAMSQGLAIIATDSVGAAAGGLVRHERNALVVPSDDAPALAAALRRLADDRPLRERLGAAGRRDVQAFTPEAWAAGMSSALDSVGASQTTPRAR